jgi:hypothetical protein
VRRYPQILDLLAKGSITLTTVTLLARHLTADNHVSVLAAAHHKTKREVEQLVVTLQPRPVAPAVVRKLPSPDVPKTSTASSPTADEHDAADADPAAAAVRMQSPHPGPTPAPRPSRVAPVTPERFTVQFTVSRATYDQLRRAQDLLRHVIQPAMSVC